MLLLRAAVFAYTVLWVAAFSSFRIKCKRSTVSKFASELSEVDVSPEKKDGSSKFYTWRKPHYQVHYETKGNSDLPPLLLLPGFGTGTFYFDNQMEVLSKEYKVYSLDFLGQGRSWPTRPISEDDGLCYSADLWTEQIIHFISDIVKEEKVHVFGNSLGGYLAVQAAAKRPDLFKSVILANAAPFWAFAPSADDEQARPSSGMWGLWNGTLPAPEPAFSFGKTYFDVIRSRAAVTAMLKGVYSCESAFDEKLISDIITSASQPGGYEAFTSILFSPKTKATFDECLGAVAKEGLPCLLAYGKEDPWVVPIWGQRALRQLRRIERDGNDGDTGASEESRHFYLEISNSGHSPNHETPLAVNAALKAWMTAQGNKQGATHAGVRHLLEEACERQYTERTGVTTELTIKDGQPTTIAERVITLFDSFK